MIKKLCLATTGRPKSDSYRRDRNKKLCIRISEEDLKLLQKIADFYDISKTDFIIMKIDEEIDTIKNIERKRRIYEIM